MLDQGLRAGLADSAITKAVNNAILRELPPAVRGHGFRIVEAGAPSFAILWLDPVSIDLQSPQGVNLSYNLSSNALSNGLGSAFVSVGWNVEMIVMENAAGTFNLDVGNVAATAQGGFLDLSSSGFSAEEFTAQLQGGETAFALSLAENSSGISSPGSPGSTGSSTGERLRRGRPAAASEGRATAAAASATASNEGGASASSSAVLAAHEGASVSASLAGAQLRGRDEHLLHGVERGDGLRRRDGRHDRGRPADEDPSLQRVGRIGPGYAQRGRVRQRRPLLLSILKAAKKALSSFSGVIDALGRKSPAKILRRLSSILDLLIRPGIPAAANDPGAQDHAVAAPNPGAGRDRPAGDNEPRARGGGGRRRNRYGPLGPRDRWAAPGSCPGRLPERSIRGRGDRRGSVPGVRRGRVPSSRTASGSVALGAEAAPSLGSRSTRRQAAPADLLRRLADARRDPECDSADRVVQSRSSRPVDSSPSAAGDTTTPEWPPRTADRPPRPDGHCGCGSAAADCGSATAADERPRAFQATEAIDSVRTNGSMDATGAFDATGPLGMATEAGSLPNSQGDAFPTGAFDPTGMATGDYDATDPGTARCRPYHGRLPDPGRGRPPGDGERSAQSRARRCGNYVLKNFFAKGGMGEVWLAEDPAIGRSVALKRMLGKRPDQQLRFRVEAQITGQLEHPGIVPVHQLGTNAEGEPYYVMKFVQGRTLQKVIEEFHARKLTGGALEVEQLRLLQMFLSLCQTVGYAHSRGVLHRDLKPENVMLGPFGETILLDWGIAKVLGQNDPATARRVGPVRTAAGLDPRHRDPRRRHHGHALVHGPGGRRGPERRGR